MMTLEEIHAVLRTAYEGIVALHGRDLNAVSADTAMAVEVLGTIRRAMALVGRDIDEKRHVMVETQPEE